MMRATTFAISVAAVVALVAAAASVFNSQESQGRLPAPYGFEVFAENFDSARPPALPPGWTSITWGTSNSGVPAPPADTLPNAAFTSDPPTISDKQLLSPNIFVEAVPPAARMSFRNNFNLQQGFDGGVLEISFDNGLTFQDIVAAGGTFDSGGYNGTISVCCGNPLAGRPAWTGNSGGFITTMVNLPSTSSRIMLRWRMGSDSGVAGEGWRFDTVVITQHKLIPPTPHPRPTPHRRPTPP
jgi:hypothetical protein